MITIQKGRTRSPLEIKFRAKNKHEYRAPLSILDYWEVMSPTLKEMEMRRRMARDDGSVEEGQSKDARSNVDDLKSQGESLQA